MNQTTQQNPKPQAKKAPQPAVEAYGVQGMKSKPWRKTFKSADALNAWTERTGAEVFGIAYLGS